MSPGNRSTEGGGRNAVGILRTAIARVRRDPVLVVPFLLAGLFRMAVDRLRLRDPVPATERYPAANGLEIRLEFVGYPTAPGRTALPLESLVGLHAEYLGWALALHLLALAAVAVAGAVTIGRAMERDAGPRAVVALFAFVLAMDLAHRAVGSIGSLQVMGLLALAAYLFVMIRLFAVPGLLVGGHRPPSALRRSARLARGRGWSLLGVIVVLGLGTWLLAGATVAGPVLAGVLAAPVHAAAIVVVLEA